MSLENTPIFIYMVKERIVLEENDKLIRLSLHDSKLRVVVVLFIAIGIFLPSSIYHIVLSQPEESHWTTGWPMSTPRSEIVGAVLADKIYIVGGFEKGLQ